MENVRQTLYEILDGASELALATSVENVPNVRIVSYITDTGRNGVLYFATEPLDRKVAEFLLNDKVAFTTIPKQGEAHVRSNRTKVKKSAYTIDDLKEAFIAKVDGYAEMIEAIGDGLDVYELYIKEAEIVLGLGEPLKISFTHV